MKISIFTCTEMQRSFMGFYLLTNFLLSPHFLFVNCFFTYYAGLFSPPHPFKKKKKTLILSSQYSPDLVESNLFCVHAEDSVWWVQI